MQRAPLRRLWLKIHRWIGLTLGPVIPGYATRIDNNGGKYVGQPRTVCLQASAASEAHGARAYTRAPMALKSTIFKATLAVADIDHGYYADHALTLARHPSETDERMMIRLVALALNAHQLQDICQGDGTLAFGAGLSNVEEPDVWLRDFTGEVKIWVEVGQPEDKPIIKACGKADEVIVYCFNHAAEIWWRGIENKLTRPQNLKVYRVPTEASQALAALAQRSMQLQATIQENTLTLGDGTNSIDVELLRWK